LTTAPLSTVEAAIGAHRLDPERRLALVYVGGPRRFALETLWRLDAALGSLVSAASQPMIAQMKLVWWRGALVRLDSEPVPAEPLLQAVQERLLAAGITGADLAQLADGWEYLAGADPLTPADLDGYAAERGGTLFRISAVILGGGPLAGLEPAGAGWALLDLSRHASNPFERKAALEAAVKALAETPRQWPVRLRPIGMMAVLAQRDAKARGAFERQGSPRRMLRMLAHRLSGR
jgi:phytoene synthase